MVVMLVWNKLPIWLVFIGALTVAMTLQLASPEALFKGYSNTGVVTVAALAAVYVGTVALTNVITNAASAVMMFSVAVSLANGLGVSFLPFAMSLMSGASCAFINPAGFQTNLMVQQPGGYKFSDFATVGVPLTLIVGVVVLLLAPIVYGF